MKNSNHDLIRASGLAALMAFASGAGAQAPPASPAPGAPAAAPAEAQDTSPAHTSYLFGLTFGEQLRSVGITNQVDQAEIARGIKEGIDGKKSTRADQQQIQAFVRATVSEAAEHNKQAAAAFLDHNGHEKGVVTTADGLQYRIIAAGNAKAPAIQPADEVTVQYRGKLLDGSEFDSSYTRGTPATFHVNGVIKGWQEALVLMKPGAKWQLFVPPDLAYGAQPHPGIPGGSLLVFDVEIVSVKSAAPPPAAGAPTGPGSNKPAAPLKPGTSTVTPLDH